jgi:biopolymer transport protein ExbD
MQPKTERFFLRSKMFDRALKLRAFTAAVPFLTVLLLMLMLVVMSEGLSSGKGVVFNLPETSVGQGEKTDLVALAMPAKDGVVVFFDDARFLMEDEVSMSQFLSLLAARFEKSKNKSILLLVDAGVPSGSVMKIAETLRNAGALKVLFAEKHKGRVLK